MPAKLRKMSVISDLTDSVVIQPSTSGLIQEIQNTVKKSNDGSEKKKTIRKKKDDSDDKIVENDVTTSVV